MAGKVRTYNPKEVLISFGIHPVSGFAEDSFINIEPNGDGVSTVVGCDGEVINSLDPNETATVTVTLLQESLTNAYLDKMWKLYSKSYRSEGMFPITVKDLRGGTLDSCEQAWVVKHSSRGYGKTQQSRELTIGTGEFSFKDSTDWK
jgi:hypothetical protein